jgi:hypothetical protein
MAIATTTKIKEIQAKSLKPNKTKWPDSRVEVSMRAYLDSVKSLNKQAGSIVHSVINKGYLHSGGKTL